MDLFLWGCERLPLSDFNLSSITAFWPILRTRQNCCYLSICLSLQSDNTVFSQVLSGWLFFPLTLLPFQLYKLSNLAVCLPDSLDIEPRPCFDQLPVNKLFSMTFTFVGVVEILSQQLQRLQTLLEVVHKWHLQIITVFFILPSCPHVATHWPTGCRWDHLALYTYSALWSAETNRLLQGRL